MSEPIDLDAMERVIPALRSWASVSSPVVKPSVGRDLLLGILAGSLPALIAELRAARKVVEAALEAALLLEDGDWMQALIVLKDAFATLADYEASQK